MDIIKTGIGITKTIKNVGRLKEIVTVFAKNGFQELILKSGVHTKIPDFVLPEGSRYEHRDANGDDGDQNNWPRIIGSRLKNAFEELGPTFIKLGQLLSSRDDLFDRPFTEEMKKLLNNVKGIPFEEGRKVIEEALGKPINQIFKHIDPTAIGTASIGIVYKGELLNGDCVVIKIRRPHIEKIVKTDSAILQFLVEKIENASAEVKQLGLSKLIREFSYNLQNELDFNMECLNAERMRSNLDILDTDKIFHLPRMHKEYCKENILVMEYLDGILFTSKEVKKFAPIIQPKLAKSLEIFIDCLLQDGFFHADLHQGNFLFLKNHQIGVIDFGLVGSLGKKGRATLISILYGVISFNFENVTYEFLEVAEYETIPDIDLLTQDIKRCVDPFLGLTIKQMDFPKIFTAIIKTLSRHKLYLPNEWFVVFRALAALDGVGRSLDLDYDIFAIIGNNIQGKVKKIFSQEEMIEDAIWGLKDIFTLTRILPRHFKWFLREFSKKNYALEIRVRGPEKELNRLANSVIFVGHAFISATLLYGGISLINASSVSLDRAVSESNHIPTMAIIFWCLSLLVFFRGLSLTKKK